MQKEKKQLKGAVSGSTITEDYITWLSVIYGYNSQKTSKDINIYRKYTVKENLNKFISNSIQLTLNKSSIHRIFFKKDHIWYAIKQVLINLKHLKSNNFSIHTGFKLVNTSKFEALKINLSFSSLMKVFDILWSVPSMYSFYSGGVFLKDPTLWFFILLTLWAFQFWFFIQKSVF
jgi:hypothetical protein